VSARGVRESAGGLLRGDDVLYVDGVARLCPGGAGMGPWAGDGVDNVLRLVTAATAGDVFSLWAGGVVEPQVPGTCP
jgi:hypothetical protein